MDLFVRQETSRYAHPDDPDTWVDIKTELTGHEERKRDELAAKTESRMRREWKKEDIEAARKKGRINKDEAEDTMVDMEVMVSGIKAELDMFDLEHYIVSWSLMHRGQPMPVNLSSFRKLSRDGFNWILTVIDEQRAKTALTENEAKNSSASSGTTSET